MDAVLTKNRETDKLILIDKSIFCKSYFPWLPSFGEKNQQTCHWSHGSLGVN